MSHGRWALAGTARVATRAICQPCNLALPNRLPLFTVAQSSGQGRERACHSGGFHVHSGRATPIIWQSLSGPKYRLSKE
jgi:hypothetical protein